MATMRAIQVKQPGAPFERAFEAYEKMMAAKARFRMVLTTGA